MKDIEKAYPESYKLARRFHELYEINAPRFGYETRKDTKEFDPESPNGRLMAYVCMEMKKERDEEWDEAIRKGVDIKILHTSGDTMFVALSAEHLKVGNPIILVNPNSLPNSD